MPLALWLAGALNTAPEVASYRLEVALNPTTHELRGHGRVTLANHTAVPLDAIYLHLYLNAFKEGSLVAASPGIGRDPMASKRAGRLDVLSFKSEADGEDLWPRHEFMPVPNTRDETDVRIPLTHPLLPGETATWEVSWTAALPNITLRTGFVGDYHFVAQWFPKLAKLEADGRFAHFPFDPRAEFYADFGNYDVEIELPTRYVVGATGQQTTPPRFEGDTQHLHFSAQGVHDFAWTAWPDYQRESRRVGETLVTVLAPPGFEPGIARTFEAVEFGLPHFGERFGPYPYPELTVVHPPLEADGAMGMEYPGLIVGGGHWQNAIDWGIYHRPAIELVTLHELAHQWFYGLLASNEQRWPFLDEGLTSYAEATAARSWLGPASSYRQFGFTVSTLAEERVQSLGSNLVFPVTLAANEYPRFEDVGSTVYAQSTLLFETLRRVHGEGVDRALASYARKFRFRHPEPQNLLDELRSELGEAVAETTRQGLFERGWIDQRVLRIENEPLAGAIIGPRTRYNRRVTVVREGTLRFPVDVEWRDAAGQLERVRWDGQDAFAVFESVAETPIAAAWIDRQHQVLMDRQLTNNALQVETRSSLLGLQGLAFWLAALLHALGP